MNVLVRSVNADIVMWADGNMDVLHYVYIPILFSSSNALKQNT